MTENKEPEENREERDGSAEEPAESVAHETAESAGESAGDGVEPELMRRLDEAESRAGEMENRYLRAVAELDNFRKRAAREKQELLKSAGSDVIESLLPALDNLKIGLKAAENHPEAREVVQGFEMVGRQILQALEEHGLKELNPEGDSFDPHYHDSVSTVPSEEVEEGHVVQTVRVGYLLNDRLLRAASVVVSSGAPEEASAGGQGEGENESRASTE